MTDIHIQTSARFLDDWKRMQPGLQHLFREKIALLLRRKRELKNLLKELSDTYGDLKVGLMLEEQVERYIRQCRVPGLDLDAHLVTDENQADSAILLVDDPKSLRFLHRRCMGERCG